MAGSHTSLRPTPSFDSTLMAAEFISTLAPSATDINSDDIMESYQTFKFIQNLR